MLSKGKSVENTLIFRLLTLINPVNRFPFYIFKYLCTQKDY